MKDELNKEVIHSGRESEWGGKIKANDKRHQVTDENVTGQHEYKMT